MNLPQRKSIRLKGCDYSNHGAYFVTICTHNRERLLGNVVGNGLDRSVHENYKDMMQLNNCGKLVESDLKDLSLHFPHAVIDKYIIMPNHLHAIVLMDRNIETERSGPFPTVSTVIGLYKSGVSRKIGHSIWQKSFHDHIVRNEQEY